MAFRRESRRGEGLHGAHVRVEVEAEAETEQDVAGVLEAGHAGIAERAEEDGARLVRDAIGDLLREGRAVAAPVHTFRSADGSKTFKGQLQNYDAASHIVTVRHESGRILKFDLQHLHPDDQTFVTSGGKDGE